MELFPDLPLIAGCGMSKRELNDWAVMNLSMEDRGEQPQEPNVGHGPTQRNGPERFLSGNLSYFGVGPLTCNSSPIGLQGFQVIGSGGGGPAPTSSQNLAPGDPTKIL